MSRPLDQLVGMGLARREIPFGESERKSKRSLYRIDDPFFRLWFRVVAPHRGQLVTASKAGRRRLLERHFDTLNAQAWEDLCRIHLTGLRTSGSIGKLGPWGPGSCWWKANLPERVVRALFVPALAARVPRRISGVEIVTGDNMLR
jgi:hypothetical protein